MRLGRAPLREQAGSRGQPVTTVSTPHQAPRERISVTQRKNPAPRGKRVPTAPRPAAAQRLTLTASPRSAASGGRWTFLTNHSHVLILLSHDPSMVLREVAALVGITERAVQRIIADLEEGGFIERKKVGRQNHYRIRAGKFLRHPIEAHRTIGDLVGLIDQV